MTAPARPDWRATREQASRCLKLAQQLAGEAAGLDFVGAGGGVRLPRRIALVIEALERVAVNADRGIAEVEKLEEREARAAQLERLAEERRRAVQATYGGSHV